MLDGMARRSPFHRFMAELRRRHVPQTAAVYMVAAWAAIQFADVVVPNLQWPQGVVTAVIIAAAVGLPVVLALAWFLDWGPEGVHRTAPSAEDEAARRAAADAPVSHTPWVAALGVLSVAIAGALIIAALQGDGAADATAGAEPEPPPTRFDRRRAGGDSTPLLPVPPRIMSPGFADSIARMIDDSLGAAGKDLSELGRITERLGRAAGRVATDGAVEIVHPEAWRYGAPETVTAGDTLRIHGIARAEGEGAGDGRVVAVEVDGRVVARSEDGQPELPFRTEWVAPEGRSHGLRPIPVAVHLRGGQRIDRRFSVAVLPRGDGG